jgi:autoinducer 2 (AI-2) kinase
MARMGQAFSDLQGGELWQKTVGLVGLGAVGRAVARRLCGFGARVQVFDPYVPGEEIIGVGALPTSLPELLEESDFVSLHAAVTENSRGLIGAEALAQMKPGAFLVNTARAALVDEAALADALADGHLGGAALDVFALEPPGADHPLLSLPNVIATPHVGGNTVDVSAHQGRIITEDLERMLSGARPQHVRNPETLEEFDWERPRPRPDAEVLAELARRPPPAVSDIQKQAEPARAAAAEPSPPRPAPIAGRSEIPGAVRAAMERILEGFVGGIVTDDLLREFATDRDVALHFTLTDLDLEFWFRMRGGALEGALGSPDASAEVELRMRADILDGMFTGRVNPMQEAMSGRLSFTGDAAKAMTLQHIQADLERLYTAARERAGDPGDLASLPDPSSPAALPPPKPGDPREQLVEVANQLYAQQLLTATGGNVSIRSGDDEVWITPSQLFKGDLRPEILVRIGIDGRMLDPHAPSPSSERAMHCAVYRSRPEAGAVVHAHAPHATILANTDLPFLPISTEAAFFGNIPRIPFIMPGTDELAEAVAAAIREEWAVLLKNHGLLVAGRSLRRAADMVEIIERAAEIILGCRAVGKVPPTLPEEVVATLREMGDLIA